MFHFQIHFTFTHLSEITKTEIKEDCKLIGDISSLKDTIIYIGKNYEISNEKNKKNIEISDKKIH